jgi:hypothetical protein
VAVVVVDYDGESAAKLVKGSLAPQLGDSIHYENFVERIGSLYERRFSGR